ncbi:MAG: ABC transporter ATP-binding protein [Thermoanaerobacteraceae bacterium]|nr:ABC transporter ATP-binding protein [Thermoanaerobacteraceae bacterium]
MLKVNVVKKLGDFFLQVDMEIGRGLTVLLGPSGCGKSSLLNLIAGLLHPDSGDITANGQVFFRSRSGRPQVLPIHRRRVGYVFQYPTLFPHLTVKENILYSTRAKDVPQQELEQLLDILRIKELVDRLPAQISGGQAQRVALARALVSRPQVLLLDEPFSALDNFVRHKLRRDLVKVLKHYNIPAVFVTHDLVEAITLGDKIAVMDEGRILQYDSAHKVFSQPAGRKVARFVGMRNIYTGRVVDVVPRQSVTVKGEKFTVEMDYRPVRIGQRVVFGIRPENVLYLRPERDQRPKENTLEVTIVSVFPQGAQYQLLLRATADVYDVEMLLPRHVVEKRNLKPGDRCRISLPRESLHLIEK